MARLQLNSNQSIVDQLAKRTYGGTLSWDRIERKGNIYFGTTVNGVMFSLSFHRGSHNVGSGPARLEYSLEPGKDWVEIPAVDLSDLTDGCALGVYDNVDPFLREKLIETWVWE